MGLRAEVHTNFGADYATLKKYRQILRKERQIVRKAGFDVGKQPRSSSFDAKKGFPSLLKHSSELIPAMSEHGNKRYNPLPMSSMAGAKYKPEKSNFKKNRKNTSDLTHILAKNKQSTKTEKTKKATKMIASKVIFVEKESATFKSDNYGEEEEPEEDQVGFFEQTKPQEQINRSTERTNEDRMVSSARLPSDLKDGFEFSK